MPKCPQESNSNGLVDVCHSLWGPEAKVGLLLPSPRTSEEAGVRGSHRKDPSFPRTIGTTPSPVQAPVN